MLIYKRIKKPSSNHYRGYGITPESLISFMNEFNEETKIPLDPIYNGKLVSGFFEMVSDELVDKSKSYLWVHTGGLQGIDAYNYMASKTGRIKLT